MSTDDNFETSRSKDLPLMANVKDVMVRHYMINLTCDMTSKVFFGQVVLFLDILDNEKEEDDDNTNFICVLDCCDIKINRVEEIIYTQQNFVFTKKEDLNIWLTLPRVLLNYSVTEWSLNIWKNVSKRCFPKVICVSYETTSKCASVTWTSDQNGRQCVYTQGSWINNRSLFPCQEPPIAMASWQAQISTTDGAVVLMTGDEKPDVNPLDNGYTEFYYYTKMILPMSTLGLAIGFWKYKVIVDENDEKKGVIPCRLFATDNLIEKAGKEFFEYIPTALSSAKKVLGEHPFGRLDIVVCPRSFASLGLASPNLLFVSQSLISGDKSMNVHLAHEICHSWFGLSIGARDWTEEWLSEGFATFVEDFVHSAAMDWDVKTVMEVSELKSLLRYRLLKAEVEETDTELQILRPNSEIDANYVKNGLNHWKAVSQVHYLKGFFLLRHLSLKVGNEAFTQLLRDYVTKYNGQLVLSKDFFLFYFTRFPEIKNPTLNEIYCDWLDCPAIPKDLADFSISSDNLLYCQVITELKKWLKINSETSERRKRAKFDLIQFEHSDQVVLLLEFLLEEAHLTKTTLKQLNSHFGLNTGNAHIRHRWCELIIKHDVWTEMKTVANFLQEDQAMGVYLYGELNLSRRRHHKKFVNSYFEQLKNEMDSSSRQIIREILCRR